MWIATLFVLCYHFEFIITTIFSFRIITYSTFSAIQQFLLSQQFNIQKKKKKVAVVTLQSATNIANSLPLQFADIRVKH